MSPPRSSSWSTIVPNSQRFQRGGAVLPTTILVTFRERANSSSVVGHVAADQRVRFRAELLGQPQIAGRLFLHRRRRRGDRPCRPPPPATRRRATSPAASWPGRSARWSGSDRRRPAAAPTSATARRPPAPAAPRRRRAAAGGPPAAATARAARPGCSCGRNSAAPARPACGM